MNLYIEKIGETFCATWLRGVDVVEVTDSLTLDQARDVLAAAGGGVNVAYAAPELSQPLPSDPDAVAAPDVAA